MTFDEPRFLDLRKRLFELIDLELERSGGYCKSYEGALSVAYPNRFEERDAAPNGYCIHLSCYLLCSGRRGDYYGASLEECMDKLEAEIEEWEKWAKENPVGAADET